MSQIGAPLTCQSTAMLKICMSKKTGIKSDL